MTRIELQAFLQVVAVVGAVLFLLLVVGRTRRALLAAMGWFLGSWIGELLIMVGIIATVVAGFVMYHSWPQTVPTEPGVTVEVSHDATFSRYHEGSLWVYSHSWGPTKATVFNDSDRTWYIYATDYIRSKDAPRPTKMTEIKAGDSHEFPIRDRSGSLYIYFYDRGPDEVKEDGK